MFLVILTITYLWVPVDCLPTCKLQCKMVRVHCKRVESTDSGSKCEKLHEECTQMCGLKNYCQNQGGRMQPLCLGVLPNLSFKAKMRVNMKNLS